MFKKDNLIISWEEANIKEIVSENRQMGREQYKGEREGEMRRERVRERGEYAGDMDERQRDIGREMDMQTSEREVEKIRGECYRDRKRRKDKESVAKEGKNNLCRRVD